MEEARKQGWTSTFVTLEVQGVVDAVLHDQLILRIHE